jgi:hypothetical protein
LKDGFEMKDLEKTKILSWFTDWTPFKWNICPSIDVYRKGLEALLHGQCLSFEYTCGCSITWCEKRSFPIARREWRNSWSRSTIS